MINVVHIIDGLGVGGAERLLFDVVTRLNKNSFTVTVISLASAKSGEQVTQQRLEHAGIEVINVPKRSTLALGLTGRLATVLKSKRPHIVHMHLFAAEVWGTMAAEEAQVPLLVTTEHNINQEEGWMKHQLKKWMHRKHAAVIAVSKAVEQYIRRSGSRSVPVKIIPNGVDLKQFQTAQQKEVHPQPRIVVVGRLTEQKGHTVLLNALQQVQREYHLDIIGDGPLRSELEQQATQRGLSEHVTFHGAQADPAQAYKDADIVVIPSLWEGFGLVAVEAMASGCAVVASDVDGLREIVENEKNGLLVAPGNTAQLTEAIERLLSDSQLKKKLTAAGIVRASEYSIEKVVERVEALYNRLT